jgi:hypothetical protein
MSEWLGELVSGDLVRKLCDEVRRLQNVEEQFKALVRKGEAEADELERLRGIEAQWQAMLRELPGYQPEMQTGDEAVVARMNGVKYQFLATQSVSDDLCHQLGEDLAAVTADRNGLKANHDRLCIEVDELRAVQQLMRDLRQDLHLAPCDDLREAVNEQAAMLKRGVLDRSADLREAQELAAGYERILEGVLAELPNGQVPYGEIPDEVSMLVESTAADLRAASAQLVDEAHRRRCKNLDDIMELVPALVGSYDDLPAAVAAALGTNADDPKPVQCEDPCEYCGGAVEMVWMQMTDHKSVSADVCRACYRVQPLERGKPDEQTNAPAPNDDSIEARIGRWINEDVASESSAILLSDARDEIVELRKRQAELECPAPLSETPPGFMSIENHEMCCDEHARQVAEPLREALRVISRGVHGAEGGFESIETDSVDNYYRSIAEAALSWGRDLWDRAGECVYCIAHDALKKGALSDE